MKLDYQPLFGKGARAPPPNSGRVDQTRESGGKRAYIRVGYYHNGIIEKEHIMSKIYHFYSVVSACFCSLCFRYFISVAFVVFCLHFICLYNCFVFSLVSYSWVARDVIIF